VPVQHDMHNVIEHMPEPPPLYFAGAVNPQGFGPGATFEVGFSPNRNALEVVMSLVLEAKEQILLAAHCLSNKEIAFALADAKRRGVDVRVVVDHQQNQEEQGGYQAVDFLAAQGIPVVRCANYSAMHHKFMVVDAAHVQLGSFNYTASARLRNAETAIAFRNAPELAEVYRTEWTRLATEPTVGVDAIMAVDRGLDVLKELGF
jgi:type IV secretion system protein VirD4